jgi:hypothetical protein
MDSEARASDQRRSASSGGGEPGAPGGSFSFLTGTTSGPFLNEH